MEVEVVTPSDFLGDVIGDLSSRRGKIGGMTQRGEAQVVAADVPLAEMFGYSTTLRSMTQGRAVYTMQFDHYEEVPKNIAEQIITQGAEVAPSPGTQLDIGATRHGQGEIRADEAARERGDDRARGPREDDADGGADEGVGGQGVGDEVHRRTTRWPRRRSRRGGGTRPRS